ncbi:hypothetical protein K504DRAFT_533783 [Pleomassaria siparia CBS 279.74]|uniref:Uncharacterized protein n=1 Tax=Pleomassaria siparia CBS 279.74 TaxID=1314801 RepID=A0A6G1K9F7_9PLEO|nr:hypothetical protein K504DRAFT_533783 [Pleomassaria siparia CBS 279.74]
MDSLGFILPNTIMPFANWVEWNGGYGPHVSLDIQSNHYAALRLQFGASDDEIKAAQCIPRYRPPVPPPEAQISPPPASKAKPSRKRTRDNEEHAHGPPPKKARETRSYKRARMHGMTVSVAFLLEQPRVRNDISISIRRSPGGRQITSVDYLINDYAAVMSTLTSPRKASLRLGSQTSQPLISFNLETAHRNQVPPNAKDVGTHKMFTMGEPPQNDRIGTRLAFYPPMRRSIGWRACPS